MNAHSKLYLARGQESLRKENLCKSDGGAAQWTNWRTSVVSPLMKPKLFEIDKHAEHGRETQHQLNSKASLLTAQNATRGRVRGDLLDRWWHSESLVLQKRQTRTNPLRKFRDATCQHLNGSYCSMPIPVNETYLKHSVPPEHFLQQQSKS